MTYEKIQELREAVQAALAKGTMSLREYREWMDQLFRMEADLDVKIV